MKQIRRDILQTYTGKVIDLDNPLETDICLRDIAEGLAKMCRFSGQTHAFYSVAAHCLNVYELVRLAGGTLSEQLYALLHDATEAYIADLPSPVKARTRGYRQLEEKLNAVIMRRFGLAAPMPRIVKWADDELLEYERGLLFDLRHPNLRNVNKFVSVIHEYMNLVNHIFCEVERWKRSEQASI
jgi:5'-deoxynucleotidase YfbR-like HD superfamily hydrolase